MQCQEEVKSMLMVSASQHQLSAHTYDISTWEKWKNEQPPLKTLFMILNDQTQKLGPQEHDIQY